MKWDKTMDEIGTASKIGLLFCFCGALWIDVAGKEELRPLVNGGTALFATALALTLAVYVWEIVRKRNRKKVHPPL